MTHQILPLFPTLVSLVQFEGAAAFNQQAREYLTGLALQGGGIRTAGQWQSRHDLHLDPVFKPLVDFVVRAVAERFEALRYRPTPMAMTGFWANINEPGFQHTTHAHANNFVSGVYYVTAPQGAGGLVFQDPRRQHAVLMPSMIEQTPMNSTMTALPAVEGQLILFPSWLEHHTEKNQSPVPRISIAFNMMLTGAFGSAETFAAGYVTAP